MGARAIFPSARQRAGMYESFYLRAVAPEDPIGVWVRYTVHKRPGSPPQGSLWCTRFDARAGRPFMHKLTSARLSSPPGDWIAIEDASMGPRGAQGSCGPARWSLTFESAERELRHLSPALLYRLPLPRTKLTSPVPAARFHGSFQIEGEPALDLEGWRGMVGHNWGSEHAERWIWLHGIDFQEASDAWLDVALGRILVAGRMTPWVANGALSLAGRRLKLGGLGTRCRVSEAADGCTVDLSGRGGASVQLRARVPAGSAAGWRYSDPDGGEHDVLNCSVAALEISVTPGGGERRALSSAHGGVFELGMRERDHGVELAPFADG